ncbi:hypothetical protein LZX86_000059 [Escherichia coli]|uniref:hypothetical protein n=1 Tax=Escherichia coli TaxID=562 RepID=UPI000DA539F5|nr:hypothetical protein [Escherichia coli]EFE8230341.1 hypothetical protein [Escherichia coli]EIS4877305.1 hypothetical protein [Escherichia coli]EMD4965733.1 hypothetical protein [Escherichia coli]SQZ76127.1 Uncharacterised protein [Escherichia coli]HAM3640778.1 hypothetical protein [Escherichia coli]
MMKKWLFCLVGVILSFPAAAEWYAGVQEDAFNEQKTAMLVELDNGRFGVVFDCNSDGLFVSVVEKSKKTESVTKELPVDLIFRIDNHPAVKMTGVFTRRNENLYGYRSDDVSSIKELLSYLRKANDRILAGAKFSDEKRGISFDITPIGSTSGVNKFIKACNIKIPE